MKFLFIVQGEGRGHLTQALALEEMLMKNGHEVIEMLVGTDSSHALPGFFNRSVQTTVKRFSSPTLLTDSQNKRVSLKKSMLYNIMDIPYYVNSILFIRRRISESGADMVISFFELLTGLAYTFFPPEIPYICVGHQYLFLHPEFTYPGKSFMELMLLKLCIRLTSINCVRRFALSFSEMEDVEEEKMVVLPPLLRSEIFSLSAREGDHVHGYMVNSGFMTEIMNYNKRNSNVELRFFGNNIMEKDNELSNLTFSQLDGYKFLDDMASCKAYASTAGFESICEAMYLGKPVMMVPVHIEQECNAYDAQKAGAGIISDSFDVDKLLEHAKDYVPNAEFKYWARSCERLILEQLEKEIMEDSLIMCSDTF